MDELLHNTQALALRRDDVGLENSSEDFKSAGGRCLGYAMGRCNDVVQVDDGAGTDGGLRGEEHPLDDTNLRELAGQSVNTADNPTRGLRLGLGRQHRSRAHRDSSGSQKRGQNQFHVGRTVWN